MEHIPVYWKTTLEDVEETMKLVKKGRVSIAATSAGGRSVYQVEYGRSNVKLGTANLSSALGAHDSKYYADKTGRRISFEYAMIDGVNDSDKCALELASRLKGILSHVNLIPINNVRETNYKKSSIDRQKKFIQILSSRGITATVRRTLGGDINASCGQLRASKRKVGDMK